VARVVVGTAGHIDHGKTALVRALTGVEADRLQEERERGMTIDLGFAPLELEGQAVGIVDVPGHERFVKNMVAGATGVDAVILVVAADDGVMPQTREHLEILRLLDVRTGLVAVTKVDRPEVDALILEALDEELDALLAGTFLAGAPRLRVDSLSGRGVPELRAALGRLLEGAGRRPAEGPFRMPVQRVFSVKGFGTVATGIPLSGAVAAGDALEVFRGDAPPRATRVRGLQAYGRPIERASAGHSTALNLADVTRAHAARGAVVATPGVFRAGTLWNVRVEALSGAPPLPTRREVRVHLGTAEVLGEVVLLEGPELAPGAQALAQLRLRVSVVATPGDRFVLRRASPLETIAGGVVLARSRWRLKPGKRRARERVAAQAAALGDLCAQAACELEEADGELRRGSEAWREAAAGLGIPGPELLGTLRELAARGAVREVEPGWFLSAARGEREEAERAALVEVVRGALEAYHRRRPTRAVCPLNELREALKAGDQAAPAGRLRAALRALVDAGGARVDELGYALTEHEAGLPPAWVRVAERVRTLVAADGLQPRGRSMLAESASPGNTERGEDVIAYLVEGGELVDAGEVVVTRAAWERSEAAVVAALEGGGRTVAELRDALGANRRFALALAEELDRRGVTVREGDRRVLRGPD